MLDDSDERILKCLDRALDSLGNAAKKATYFYLAKENGVAPQDLIKNPERFARALQNLFGETTATIERLI